MLGLIEESGKVVKDVKNIDKKVTQVKLLRKCSEDICKNNCLGNFYFFTKKKLIFGRFFCHGRLGHPQSLEYLIF